MARTMDKQPTGGRAMKNANQRRRRTTGAVQVEYAFLLVFIMVPTAPILLAGGKRMYDNYKTLRSALLSSTP